MKTSASFLAAGLLGASAFSAGAVGYLQNCVCLGTYGIATNEASGLAYNPDTGTLFIIGDEGRELQEYSTQGVLLGGTALGGFSDTEGVAYLGGGKFMIADERIQRGSVITYTGSPTPTQESHANYVPGYSFGPSVGNVGLEGVSYDRLTNSVWGVKELGPETIYQMSLAAGSGSALMAPTFDPAGLGLADLSDIYVMAACAAFAGTDREWNLLILSQESKMLVEVTRTGEKVSSLDLSNLGLPKNDTIEGVTMDNQGNIYLVAEGGSKSLPSHLYVFSAVPEPSAAALGSLAALVLLRRRR